MVSTIITPTGNYRGFQVEFTGCKTDAFVVYAKGDPYLWTAKWGNAANISLHKEWSHFAFTFKANEGISIFFNGNEVKKDVVSNFELNDYVKSKYMIFDAMTYL